MCGDAADHHARALHRAAHLEAADVGELGVDLVGLVGGEAREVADLEREEDERGESYDDEDSDPQIDHRAVHQLLPPVNINAVRTKSSARMASDEVTTVRVVARETPSAVGTAS